MSPEPQPGGPAPPTVSLPRGGGAIRGIGEKFGTNPATGTGTLTVPIPASPGREGFGPDLALAYDSGAGNGPFGFGWSLGLAAISRKTDDGLPRYRDAEESDVYLLSGAEDLVPVLEDDGTRHEDRTTAPGYVVNRYRPRVEGLFGRIERGPGGARGEVQWRTNSRDNVTSLYGVDDGSRVVDRSGEGPRVFKWLLSQSYDAKGSAIAYEYAAEDDAGVDASSPNERNRTTAGRAVNRYPRRILYGNRVSRLVEPDLSKAEWLFELVFDYDEGRLVQVPPDPDVPAADQHELVLVTPERARAWAARPDPFSSHRAGFEVRTYRRCSRILIFHHIPDQPGNDGYDGLVRSLEIDYDDLPGLDSATVDEELAHPGSTRLGSFARAITQAGYAPAPGTETTRRDGVSYRTYRRKALPPLELEYSQPLVSDSVQELDAASLENLPGGLTGLTQFTDLDGNGIGGVLSADLGAWFYKRNLGAGRLGPVAAVDPLPAGASLASGKDRLADVTGDAQLDLATLSAPGAGFYPREEGGWAPFRTFGEMPQIDWEDPNARFVDLSGDGQADLLITDDGLFTWYESLAGDGFEPAQRVAQPADEERGPRLVFADGAESIYLADMSGDGLSDLVRIRNGDLCYWPNLGYGRFGAKVALDNAPWLDEPDQFDQRGVRLADVDGSGTSDLIYIGADGVRLYFNQSGNRLSDARPLRAFPHVDDIAYVDAADLLGSGTACLVWSSPLPGDAGRAIRYVDLMANGKPHLLVGCGNNLGARTRLEYAPSTHFHLVDELAGRPWVTRLPFPVQVVARTLSEDLVSGNRFETRYAYHHGYFDAAEREFRGFGMVEQWDSASFAALDGEAPAPTNLDPASDQPPTLTKTWFHTGAFLGREHVSDYFAGLLDEADLGEYYREPGLSDAEARSLLLDDTVLDPGLSAAEEREACRALRGATLRQEVYALDGGDREAHPYTVLEQCFGVRRLQQREPNRHGVFLRHGREAITFHYDRRPEEARAGHSFTLEVDDFGNELRTATVAYGRRQPDPELAPADQAVQSRILATTTERSFTSAVEEPDDYRAPLARESLEYELTGLALTGGRPRLTFDEVREAATTAAAIAYDDAPTPDAPRKRLVEQLRTYYRRDDLTGPLPLGGLEPLALPFETQRLALTPQLLARAHPASAAAPDPAAAGYVHSEGDANWWVPSTRVFYSADPNASAAAELAYAREHFFLPLRYRDPFHTPTRGTESFVAYDAFDLMISETRDALGNRTTVGERDGDPTKPPPRLGHDYRTLQPAMVMDPNRNRSAVAFDALGLPAGTAVMGKPEDPPVGDRLDPAFNADLTEAEIDAFLAAPTGPLAAELLGAATSRVVYDRGAFQRGGPGTPAFAATLTRETHASDVPKGGASRIQPAIAYSDGFGRELQRKRIAEPGPAPLRDGAGAIVLGADGEPRLSANDVSPRWICSGWTVVNNKGKPVLQYEAFFSDRQSFEPDVRAGVSPVFLYDPVERLVATLHPDHSWEKVVFHPWRQDSWDASDTVATADPRADADVGGYFAPLPEASCLPSWSDLRTDPANGAAAAARWPDAGDREAERQAAEKAAIHAATPTSVHVDANGRTFLAVARNKTKYSDAPASEPPLAESHETRTVWDIEGNKLQVSDALGRIVERSTYDMVGNLLHHASIEAGERWALADVTGAPVRGWDSRDHAFRTTYDELRRPVEFFLSEGGGAELLVGRNVYGETLPAPEAANRRTKVVERLDQSGRLRADAFDFKGNALASRRQLAAVFDATLDWSGPVALADETFVREARYDAFNRPVQAIGPYSDGPEARLDITQPTYNEAGLLEALRVWLGRAAEPAALLDPETADLVGVSDIDYDAQGRRTRIVHGNEAVTTSEFDRLSSRLLRLETRRDPTAFPADCPAPAPAGWPGCRLQSLRYAYDPVGNHTSIRDRAQQTIFFRNRRVAPDCDYTYDAVGRLVEATGREHLGQVGVPIPHSHDDAARISAPQPTDGGAMGAYRERYEYDLVGNPRSMRHRGTDPAAPGWTRAYAYEDPSQIEPAHPSNRLTSTTVGSVEEVYSSAGDGYDPHGNQLRLPHLTAIEWSYKDELRMTSRQAVNGGEGGEAEAGERTWFVYDAAGQRVRKVTVAAGGAVRDERIYLEGFEIYRRHTGGELERQTLHVTDGDTRFALVESRTSGDDGSPARLPRFQIGNHLKSATIELDDQAAIITYAEYTPYGSTAYQATGNQAAAAARYRFSGKERDEETGFYAFGARYYAPWLGRWLSTDPVGTGSGVNLYQYCRSNPVRLFDPSGADGEDSSWHVWDRTLGGLKMVGGGLETVAGAGLVAAGVATSEIGVGVLLIGAGAVVTAHGADTTVSGARTMWNGAQVDTFTSQGLQAAGMTKTEANLTDAGISIVGTLGANVVTRAPTVAATVATDVPSVTVSHAAGAPSAVGVTNPLGYAIGHTRVGVTLGDGSATVWSHLTVPPGADRVMMSGGALVESGTAVVSTGENLAPRFASVVTVPVTAQEAEAAMSLVQSSAGQTSAYGLFVNDCASYGQSVLNTAGVTASGSTPSTLFVSTALRSESPAMSLLTAPVVMQPVTTAGAVVNATVGATSMTYSDPVSSSRATSSSSSSQTSVQPAVRSQSPLLPTGVPDPAGFSSYEDFAAAVGGPYTQDFIMETWASVHGWQSNE